MGTQAVPTDFLVRANMGDWNPPLCPGCRLGRLHPFRVEVDFGLPGFHGVSGLTGWVVVCQGAKAGEHFVEQDLEPCGFSMPMTPVPSRVPMF